MVELFKQNIRTNIRQSSKGNQLHGIKLIIPDMKG